MNLSHVNGISRLLGTSERLNCGWQVLNKKCRISLLGTLLLMLAIDSANAAGPRPKDLYLNLGGGVFTPEFTLTPNAIVGRVDGELGVTTIVLPLIGQIPLIGLAGSTDNDLSRPENRTILSLDASLGYKYNRHFGIEINLDLGFPNILIRDVGIDNVLSSDTDSTGRVQILAPDLLPIGASFYYTPAPDFLISPYAGFGGMMVFLNNRRASSSATEILILEGDVEFGWMFQAGAHVDISQDWFGFFDIKYATIDEPQFETKQGIPAPVDKLEIRHIRVGVGLRF